MVLHLLGYDRMNEEDEKNVWTPKEILNAYGLTRD